MVPPPAKTAGLSYLLKPQAKAKYKAQHILLKGEKHGMA